MNLIQLEYFCKTAECGSVTAAAKKLFITQPAVSKQLHLLEEELHCQVFVRGRKPLTLSPAGEKLLERARAITASIRNLPSEIDRCLNRVEGILRIGCGPHTSTTIMPDVVTDLLHQYPCIHPSLQELDWREARKELAENRLDIVIGVVPEDTEKLTYVRLFKTRMVLVYAANSDLAKAPEVTPDLLARTPCIAYAGGVCWSDYLARLDYFERSPRFLESRYTETLLTYVQRNLGYAVVPEYVMRGAEWKNIAIDPADTGLEVEIGFMIRHDRTLSPMLRALIGILSKKYNIAPVLP